MFDKFGFFIRNPKVIPEVKFCRDCKFCDKPTDKESKCLHPKAKIQINHTCTDCVTGELCGKDTFAIYKCKDMRDCSYGSPAYCANGKLFEPK